MSSGWRYIAERLNGDGTGTILDLDVPLSEVEITDSLSDVNALNAKITPEIKRLIGADGTPLFQEWSTALYAEKNGQIRAGGILVHSDFQGSEWGLECVGFLGYGKDMPYTGGGEFFVKTDTLDIARFIWDHIQAQNGGNIGLTFDQRKSGIKVGTTLTSDQYDPEGGSGGLTLESQAYKLAYYQDLDLLSNFDDLASETPFHYHERHYWAPDGTITHHVDFPSSLSMRQDLRFAVGENIIVSPSISLNGDDYASETYFLGAGEGARTIRGHASLPRKRLRRVAVKADASVRRLSAANGRAMNDLAWRRNLEDLTEITHIDHPSARLGAVDVGDLIFIQGDVDWLGQIESWYQVTSIMYQPEASQQTLTVARADKVMFGATTDS
jgi:hypothetical protein